jgi:hypothetical protein
LNQAAREVRRQELRDKLAPVVVQTRGRGKARQTSQRSSVSNEGMVP